MQAITAVPTKIRASSIHLLDAYEVLNNICFYCTTHELIVRMKTSHTDVTLLEHIQIEGQIQ